MVFIKIIIHNMIKLFMYILRIFPINNNKIIFSNYYGKGYGDNCKYICDKLLNENDVEIIWAVTDIKKNCVFPEKVRPVKYRSIKYFYELATSKIWVDNCRKDYYIRKRKEQFYIQTWHGGIALKKIEKDVINKLDSIYVKSAKNDSKMANLFISNSEFCTNKYLTSFWYNGEILECGSPRCDILINANDEIRKRVKDYFNIPYDTNILLYAPTFRDNYDISVYNINFIDLIKALEEKFNGKWCILIRLHPNMSHKYNLLSYSSKIINASIYDDMYELLATSNILITDYSSTMFEFSYTAKPIFLYTPDLKEYRHERNFYFDMESLPYPLAENTNQLLEQIRNFNYTSYKKKIDDFLLNLGIYENGNASLKVYEVIINILRERDKKHEK